MAHPMFTTSAPAGGAWNGGGTDLFLQANVPNAASGWVGLNHPVNITLDAKLSGASATYMTPLFDNRR
jgi:hypothetical protein